MNKVAGDGKCVLDRVLIVIKESDLAAAKRLQDIMEEWKGAPLTAEEIARSHRHVKTMNDIFDAEMREEAIK